LRLAVGVEEGRSRLARGSAFGEEGAGLFGGEGFAALGLGEGGVEVVVEGVTVAEDAVLCCGFGFGEIEGVGEELGGFAEAGGGEFALEAGFGGGLVGDGYRLVWVVAWVDGCGCGGGRLVVAPTALLRPAAAWGEVVGVGLWLN
jgi:hypothetical protein